MADDGSAQSATVWPQPTFGFEVEWDGGTLSCQEVSGLEAQTIGNVTLKHGVIKSDDKFWTWFKQVQMNKIERKTVTIRLLDEAGRTAIPWTLANAFPTKISGPDLDAQGGEVAVETLELSHEGVTIANG